MKKIVLSNRLLAVAAYVQGPQAADIGTDHGFLPVWLLQNGICSGVIASDVRPGPLAAAKETARKYGLIDQIRFRLANGLEGLEPGAVDTVILAGMGGETQAAILKAASWLAAMDTVLVLQPQSKLDVLTTWLWRAGYAITAQRLARDDDKLYTILRAERGATEKPELPELFLARALRASGDALLPDYLDITIHKREQALNGLRRAGREDPRAARLAAALTELKTMREAL